jgi:purine-nucleoside phosphorylase
MSTPHISAQPGDFAPAVLFPGDPKRAQRIAEQVLESPRLVTDVRGILGFTGTYQGKPLSVMASGMGMPSATIYATELYRFYGVERIIRIGTAGGLSEKVEIGDVVIGLGAHTDSSMNATRIPGIHFSAVADWQLVSAAVAAGQGDPHIHIGTIFSGDHFYDKTPGLNEALAAHGCLAVEMEAAGLYGVAATEGKAALAVTTISDHLTVPSRDLTAEERETIFGRALNLVVAAALS